MSVRLADIWDQELELDQLVRLVGTPGHGAVATFSGCVRDHDGGRDVTRLAYEAHPDAVMRLRESAERIAERGVTVAVLHRTGSLAIGDVAIAAAVSAPHRREAFAAIAELVDDVKATVPIWKHQFYADGSDDWVNSP